MQQNTNNYLWFSQIVDNLCEGSIVITVANIIINHKLSTTSVALGGYSGDELSISQINLQELVIVV